LKAGAKAPKKEAALRRRAKTRLTLQKRPAVEAGSEAEVRRLLHELQVHEIELEMQNEELKQAGLAARESADKYTELYDFAPIGYFSLDRAGRFTEANLAVATMLGLQRSRLLRRNFESLVPMEARPAFREFLARIFERGSRGHREMVLNSFNGEPIDVRWDSVVTSSGSQCRVAMVDISSQKRAERDRLILSQLESLGVLAGGIAHDFNNLLSVILLSIEVADSQIDPAAEKAKGYLADATRAVFLAQGLTRKFIALASSGAPAREPVELPGLIRESVRTGLGDSGVKAEFAVPDDLWTVKVDEGQIGQVIQNVVLNAKEAMPEGGTVRVRAQNVTLEGMGKTLLPGGDYVCVSVADTGAGIPKEALPKIFDPYFSTKSRGTQKGMGLGLTISHAIMQRNKGAISAESEEGAGATLHLYFPVSPDT
jgi:two-component system cell cycle sensor histidine kinase/response regulator CckA